MVRSSAVVKQLLYPRASGNFGGTVGTTPFVFGLDQKASGISFTENQQPLINPNSGLKTGYSYGNTEAKFGLEWVMSDASFMEYALGMKANAGDVDTYTFVKDKVNVLDFVYTHTDYWELVRNAIMTNLTLESSIGNRLMAKAQFEAGDYATGTTNVYNAVAQPTDSVGTPLVFSDVELQIEGNTVAEVQSFNIGINTSAKLNRGLGSSKAIGVYKEVLDMSGKVSLRFMDGTNLAYVQERAEQTSFLVRLSRGTRQVDFTFAGIGVSKREIPSIGMSKVVDEAYDFEARTLTVVDDATA